MDKKIVIVNSMICARKRDGYSKEALSSLIFSKISNVPIYFTEHPAHATFIAQENAAADLNIVAGGDGTISEVLNGMDLNSQNLGIIPMGTGNSFARQAGIHSFEKALDVIGVGGIRPVDIIKCSMTIGEDVYERYAVATTGFGYVANVADIGNIWFKGAGKFCYVIASLFAFLCPDTLNAQITIDDNICLLKKVTNMLMNNTSYSGNFRVFTEATIDDGNIHVMYSFNNKAQQLFQNIGIFLKKRWHLKSKFQKIEKIDISFEKPTKFMIDGEIFDYVSEVSINILPGKLKLIV